MNLDKTLRNLRQTKNSYFNQKNGNPLNFDIIKKGLQIYKGGTYYVYNITEQSIGSFYTTKFKYGKYYGFIFNDETTTVYKISKCI